MGVPGFNSWIGHVVYRFDLGSSWGLSVSLFPWSPLLMGRWRFAPVAQAITIESLSLYPKNLWPCVIRIFICLCILDVGSVLERSY